MSTIPFWKVESVGNDFVLVHESDVASLDLSALTIKLCARQFGIGSDGLLVLGPASSGLTLRMFNPDGTEDFCGNGLRCAAMHGNRLGWVGERFDIEHLGRTVEAEVRPDGSVTTVIGVADPRAASVPLDLASFPDGLTDEAVCGLVGSAISTGSTHFVAIVDSLPDDERFVSVSSAIEMSPVFPSRTSVIWTQPLGERELKLRIWERGVGETLGCGTGTSAAAAVWFRRHGLSGEVLVHNPGGDLVVSMDSWDGAIRLTGRAHEPFSGLARV